MGNEIEREGEVKVQCKCCGCRIQIQDDLDIRICEECTDCPKFIDVGPCLQNGEATVAKKKKKSK